MIKLKLSTRKEPLSEKDKRLISVGTMIRLGYEGKEPFYAVIQTGTTAKVDSGNTNFFSAGVKIDQEVSFKSNNILGIL